MKHYETLESAYLKQFRWSSIARTINKFLHIVVRVYVAKALNYVKNLIKKMLWIFYLMGLNT